MGSVLRQVQFSISGHSLRKPHSKSLYGDGRSQPQTVHICLTGWNSLLELICSTGGENQDVLTGFCCLYVHGCSFIIVSPIYAVIKSYSRAPTKQ